MTSVQKSALLNACRILFPSAVITNDFLDCVHQDGLKNAYRSRAWEHHPDAADSNEDTSERTEQFRRTAEAYKLLDNYLKGRKNPMPVFRSARHRSSVCKPAEPVQIKGKHPGETYYEGELPTFEMKTGLYLYYRGAVSYEAFVRAMMWQRDMRPPLGTFGKKWGWLSDRDISLVLRATDIVGTFGERALELGLLSQSQLNLLLLQQRAMQKPVGNYFTSNALLSEYTLKQYLKDLAKHNANARLLREQDNTDCPATRP